MAANDKADQVGHTHAQAEAQHPQLDLTKPAASQERPTGDEIVLAQTPDEVESQINGDGPD